AYRPPCNQHRAGLLSACFPAMENCKATVKPVRFVAARRSLSEAGGAGRVSLGFAPRCSYLEPVGLLLILSAISVLVTGTVRDSSGAPIAGASVYLRGVDVFSTTEADGRFELTGAVSGDVVVVASRA